LKMTPSHLRSIEPKASVQRLERLFAVEKILARLQGARLPDLESWALKQKVGYFLYEDVQHANSLRLRRKELRAGSGEFLPLDPDLENVLEQVLFVPGDYLFCYALYLGCKLLLVQAYRRHLEESTIFSDQPSRQVFETIIANEERQIAWVEGALEMMPGVAGNTKKSAQEWVENVQRWMEAAGGLLADLEKKPGELPPVRRYEAARKARREPRQKATFAFEAPLDEPDELKRSLLTQFTAYFREMAAAETMAALLWEAPQEMPWEFFMDSTRHFWDEIRHCQVGQQRLEGLGLDIWEVPVQTGHYDTRAHMPLLERYAFLTQVQEAESFKVKRENEARFRNAGDRLSADMVAYDMADERNHVRYGTKWIPELQKVLGDDRSMEALVADARKLQAEVWERLSGGSKADPNGQY
jgi:hypothetical protein